MFTPLIVYPLALRGSHWGVEGDEEGGEVMI